MPIKSTKKQPTMLNNRLTPTKLAFNQDRIQPNTQFKKQSLSPVEIAWLKQTLGEIIQITPIEQGHTNACFKLNTTTQTYFVKKLNIHFLNREAVLNEYHARQWLSNQVNKQLTPKIIAESPELGLIIQLYYRQSDLAQSQKSKSQKIQIQASLLSQLHQQPSSTDILRQQIHKDLYDILTKLDENLSDHHNLLNAAKVLDENSQLNCVCHGDLSFYNILDAQPALMVDWEFARLAEPAYDLAASILINQYTPTESNHLIHHYAQYSSQNIQQLTNKINAYLFVLKPLNHLWYKLRQSD